MVVDIVVLSSNHHILCADTTPGKGRLHSMMQLSKASWLQHRWVSRAECRWPDSSRRNPCPTMVVDIVVLSSHHRILCADTTHAKGRLHSMMQPAKGSWREHESVSCPQYRGSDSWQSNPHSTVLIDIVKDSSHRRIVCSDTADGEGALQLLSQPP